MAEDLIRYDILAQDALRGVVRKVLAEVAKTGLPGEHHFYITIATRSPGVRVSTRLLNEYPEDMTIVLQHQFWDLTVTEHSFEVGLSFGGIPERLLVPFTAVKGFIDPSVQFALQFQPQPAEVAEDEEPGAAAAAIVEAAAILTGGEPGPREAAAAEAEAGTAGEDEAGPPAPGQAEIVRLDAFRKKH